MSQLSLRGLRWAEPAKVDIKVDGVPDELVQIAASRGITDFKAFFKPKLQDILPDPLVLKDMDKAIARAMAACEKRQKVCVFGDYDVDGACSGSIVRRYMRAQGCEVMPYIPERLTEGYGPNVEAMQKIAGEGVDLLIVVDSGSTAFEPLKEAVRLGMEVIVLDHHPSRPEHPPCILVNPNRHDEDGKYSYLCAAGVAFLFAVGLQRELRKAGWFEGDRKEYDMHALLGLAALATVCDVVPQVGANRAIVKVGLRHMVKNPGIRALAEGCQVDLKKPTADDCGFRLGPRINAASRIDSSQWGICLLSSDDEDECAKIAELMEGFNEKRKAIGREMEASAYEQADELAKTDQVIVAYDEEWHPGIIGIVAARVKERHDRPAIVIGKDGKGSARSFEGYSVGGAIMKAFDAGLLKKGGGHAMAAGLTILPEKVEAFRSFMQTTIEGLERPPLDVDLVLEPNQMSKTLVENFRMLAPFGAGNTYPKILLKNAFINKIRLMKGLHIKAVIPSTSGDIEAVMFNAVDSPLGKALLAAEGGEISIYGEAQLNEYNGKVSVQIRPEDLRPADPPVVADVDVEAEGSEQAA